MYIKNTKQKAYDLFEADAAPYRFQYQQALICISQKEKYKPQNEHIQIESIWQGLSHEITEFTKSLVFYIQNLPGLDTLASNEIIEIVNRRIFTVYGLRLMRLFINNENYHLLPDFTTVFSKYWMNRTFGVDLCKLIFVYHDKLNRFCLTDRELSLLLPVLLSTTGNLKIFVIIFYKFLILFFKKRSKFRIFS